MDSLIEYAPITGLLFFFAAFLWIAFQAYRPSQKNILQSHAFIPLKEENNGQL
jgi:cbb3-type cytochrome oxidase subunit 3